MRPVRLGRPRSRWARELLASAYVVLGPPLLLGAASVVQRFTVDWSAVFALCGFAALLRLVVPRAPAEWPSARLLWDRSAPAAPPALPVLARAEAAVRRGTTSRRDYEVGVRPLLTRVARDRLARSGAPASPAVAALLAGRELAGPATDRRGRETGVPVVEVARLVDEVAAL